MSIAKNTKETFLEEIIDNLSGNTRELPVDCKPRTREEVLLAEIEKNTRELNNDEPINIDLSNYYTKEETNNLVEEQTYSVINDSDTSSTNTWSSQKIVDYVATVDDVIFEEANGSVVTVNNSVEGYLKTIEILGNTIQNEDNLEDIRSVGDKIEGQELYEIPVLSCGKNLWNYGDTKFVPKNADRWCNFEGTNELMYGDMTGKTSVKIYLKEGNYYVAYNVNNSKNIKGVQLVEIQEKSVYDRLNNVLSLQEGVYTIRIKNELATEVVLKDFMICASDVATPYEPYVEDKITILLPCQLEKVGDVSDRIICKDGVWGIEKNIGEVVLNGSESWTTISTNDLSLTKLFRLDNIQNVKTLDTPISSKFVGKNVYSVDEEGYYCSENGFRIRVLNTKLPTQDVAGFKTWLSQNQTLVKYQLSTPQFIPLPHDQQVKLRTFANKTNISFLTEIEGTIKAQVPKSLGATVNTHTEQIGNLNKELDRVKKLEESTVSTVTTESDFTTVEATSNGYFEDVKLEGKTLVNLISDNSDVILKRTATSEPYAKQYIKLARKLMSDTTYTLIFNVKNNNLTTQPLRSIVLGDTNAGSWDYRVYWGNDSSFPAFGYSDSDKGIGVHKIKFTTPSDFTNPAQDIKFIGDSNYVYDSVINNIIILEGDHTQNPPSYFEGLKSVGQSATTSEDGTDEIVVSSVKGDGNLFDVTLDTQTKNGVTFSYDDATGEIVLNGTCTANNTSVTFKYHPKFIKGNTYYLRLFGTTINSPLAYIRVYDDKYVGNNLATTNMVASIHNSSSTRKMVNTSIRVDSGVTFNNFRFKVQLTVNEDKTEYIPHQSDKKRLLFYNNETQTWEKPILREWDSIEKHADSKYYYHQRSAEIVLNGSENISTTGTNTNNTMVFGIDISTNNYNNQGNSIVQKNVINNKFSSQYSPDNIYSKDDIEGISITDKPRIRILKSKLSSQDVEGFKQWLQTNNVTVVYQLAEEKVYECTNIDLITYANETNYIVECGAISPKTTLKVHNNISNVVSLLQKKVSILESNMTKYMITQNRMQLASTYSADSVTFKVDYALCSEETEEYNEDLYNLILNNILVGKDNYNYDKMFTMILDYVTWGQLSFENFDTLVGLMDIQHNPPIDEEVTEEI